MIVVEEADALHAANLLHGVLCHPAWHLKASGALASVEESLRKARPILRLPADTKAEAIDIIQGFIDHPWWQGIDRRALGNIVDGLMASEMTIEIPLPRFAIAGEEVIYSALGGTAFDIELADTRLTRGLTYRVASISIGRSSSSYRIEEVEGDFNSCLFDFADPENVRWESSEARARRNAEVQQSYDFMYPSFSQLR